MATTISIYSVIIKKIRSCTLAYYFHNAYKELCMNYSAVLHTNKYHISCDLSCMTAFEMM